MSCCSPCPEDWEQDWEHELRAIYQAAGHFPESRRDNGMYFHINLQHHLYQSKNNLSLLRKHSITILLVKYSDYSLGSFKPIIIIVIYVVIIIMTFIINAFFFPLS